MQKQGTIGELEPGMPLELSLKHYKSSHSPGTHLLALRKPHRIPESSRSYVVGDPIQLIDWKAFARSGELIIRQVQQSSQAKVRIFIDASPEMNWPDAETERQTERTLISKLELAMRVGFHLGHLHHRLGDQVSIAIHRGNPLTPKLEFQPKTSKEVNYLFRKLREYSFEIDNDIWKVAPIIRPTPRSKLDLIYYISDCLEGFDHFYQLKAKRSILFHFLSSLEASDYWIDENISYIETNLRGKEFLGRSLLTGQSYLAQIDKWRQELRARVEENQSDYYFMTENTEILEYLKIFELIKLGGRLQQ